MDAVAESNGKAQTAEPDLRPQGIGALLGSMIPQVRQALEQGEAHERALQAALAEQRDENNKTRRLLGIIDPDYVHPNDGTKRFAKQQRKPQPSNVGVPRSNGTSTGEGITMERAKDYAEEVLKVLDGGAEYVTQPEIYKVMGTDQGQCSSAFRWFRKIEFLRKAGRDPKTKREVWKLMDRDAVDKAIAEAERRNAEAEA